ncbi:unnamed protein product (macronuclear) [Paramecium tetraurelia]|uniref:Uncharacterized protein n=1 Tax=Paramecium tetraurelia TaxID=5888 RepID=A0CLP1_PARTE|nr:uncharacterized protein GSPATT00008257001 [Paramecium tetraurelia]CAK71708.1 unnamed protein product [Paramecium tetraurelia]|eukprot:XP_001439105.1 hypothetical protein (macronuclear) [Paramecium tetraurelia strain d4-2]
MNKKIVHTYNKISDVFSRAQIKNAVESLDNYQDRLKLIDSVIDRRQQIIQVNDLSKMSQYAHLFRRMIHRYRSKKEGEAANERLQMRMVVSVFASQEKQSSPCLQPKNLEQRNLDQKRIRINEISDQRRDAVQFKVNRTQKITNMNSERKSFNQRSNTKEGCQFSNRTQRVLSSIDVDNRYQEKELYLLTGEDQEIKSLQSKIKQSVVLKTRINLNQNTKDNENLVRLLQKQHSSLSRRQYKPYSQQQIQDNCEKEQEIKRCDKIQNILNQEESFLSYSENLLNQLYKKSSQIQKKDSQSQHNHQKLIKTNKEIIELSKIKLALQVS